MEPIQNLTSGWAAELAFDYLTEIVLCVLGILIIFAGFFKSHRVAFYVATAGIVLHLLIVPKNDDVDSIFKIIFSLSALVTVLLSKDQRSEFFLLIISVVLGADLLIGSTNFIMVLLSMELISISSYVLVAGLNPDRERSEAAWKFFLYGSVATAVMIFGMSYYFGATGNLRFVDNENSALLTVGGVMILAGLLFKMTSVPFHLWAPDVYQATPSPVIAFISVVPKLAAFLFITGMIGDANRDWSPTISAIAILTIVVGTLAALTQTNSKRMMAYSSVAQAGFLLVIPASFETLTTYAYGPVVFYGAVFAIMNYVVFIVIHVQEQQNGMAGFSDFSGLVYKNPLAAVAITLGLVSLVGIPPMAGFMAKLVVFARLWAKFDHTQNLIFLALFVTGLLATAASLYFYLKIPFYAFFRRSEENPPIKIPLFTNLLLVILVALLLVLFIAPGLLMG